MLVRRKKIKKFRRKTPRMREGIHQEICRGKIKNRMIKKKSKRNHQESMSVFFHTPSDKNVLVRQLHESP